MASEPIAKRNVTIRGVNPVQLFGTNDAHLRLIEDQFQSKIVARGDTLIVEGPPAEVETIENIFAELTFLLHRKQTLARQDVETVLRVATHDQPHPGGAAETLGHVVVFTPAGYIAPKTRGQAAYVEATRDNDLVFAIGPAGTGKTYLAVAVALAHLKDKRVKKIILARPAVEAGESLGFLPGDLQEKVDPYLRPLTDALFEMLPPEKLKMYLERRIIEIVPLAYMRGRTLDNGFLILDEAQNTTAIQMKMFLTRLGVNARAIVTGDVTQVDLVDRGQSGLIQIQDILNGVEGIAFVYLQKEDVVRHKLVKAIIAAYDSHAGENHGPQPHEDPPPAP